MKANKLYLTQLRACRAAANFIDRHTGLVNVLICAYTLIVGVYVFL